VWGILSAWDYFTLLFEQELKKLIHRKPVTLRWRKEGFAERGYIQRMNSGLWLEITILNIKALKH
jgi:hypothetical protein